MSRRLALIAAHHLRGVYSEQTHFAEPARRFQHRYRHEPIVLAGAARESNLNICTVRPNRHCQEAAQTIPMTDSALRLACNKNQVPLPPRGYWRKVQAGMSLRKPPLPAITKPNESIRLGVKRPDPGRDSLG